MSHPVRCHLRYAGSLDAGPDDQRGDSSTNQVRPATWFSPPPFEHARPTTSTGPVAAFSRLIGRSSRSAETRLRRLTPACPFFCPRRHLRFWVVAPTRLARLVWFRALVGQGGRSQGRSAEGKVRATPNESMSREEWCKGLGLVGAFYTASERSPASQGGNDMWEWPMSCQVV